MKDIEENDYNEESSAIGFGNVKGTITWQYNDFVGTKGDVGAAVYLIPTDINVESIDKNSLEVYLSAGTIPRDSQLYFTKADGYGNYELNYIPEGEYLLVFSSRNTTRNLNEPVSDYTANQLTPILREYYPYFEQFRLRLYNSKVEVIQITKDRTINYSHDFGFTYL